MSKTLKLQVIEKARALIEDEQHWCRGELARDMNALSVCPTDSGAERRCALGALIAAAYEITDDLSWAHDLAISAVRPLYGSATLVNVNDVRGHAAVLALLDEVLAAMQAVPTAALGAYALAYRLPRCCNSASRHLSTGIRGGYFALLISESATSAGHSAFTQGAQKLVELALPGHIK